MIWITLLAGVLLGAGVAAAVALWWVLTRVRPWL